MAKLYYGNGNCSIEGSDVRGVDITYKGAITITDNTSDSFAITHYGNRIMVFPIGEGVLNNLFDYVGEIKIISVMVADNNAQKVSTSIHRVMDYSELLTSNSEDMTINSEDLSAGHLSGIRPSKTTLDKQIIPNLNTASQDIDLYLASGESYGGSFHVHLKDNNAMTGGEHDENSKDLYYKKVGDDKLTPTKNPSFTLRVNTRRSRGRKIKRTTKTTSGTGGY